MEAYEIMVTFNEDEFDDNGQIKADRLFYYFQEASSGDVNKRGVGPDDLFRNNQIWVLTKMKIIIDRKLQPGVEYICGTFPVRKKNVTYKRDYYIRSIDSDSIASDSTHVKGAAQWCIIDYDTRKPLRTDICFEEAGEDEEMIGGRFPKIRGVDPQPIMEYEIKSEDIDFNDHTNNSRYIALTEIATGKNITSELYVNFAEETRLGDKLYFLCEEQEEGTYVEGRKDPSDSESKVFQIIFR